MLLGLMLSVIACIPFFKGPPHQVAYPLGYWKAGIEALANKNILRLNALNGFTKDITSKTPFGAINERKRIDMLKCLYSYTCARADIAHPV